MKDIEKHLFTMAVVAGGVIAAGWTMYALRTNTFIGDARKGFTSST